MKITKILFLFVLLSVGASAVYADTIIGPGLSASANVSGSAGVASGSITFKNADSTQSLLAGFALSFGSGSISGLNITGLPAGWTTSANSTLGNDGSPCGVNGGTGWLCADGYNLTNTAFSPGWIPANGEITFGFSFNYAGADPSGIHLQANGCDGSNYGVDYVKVKGQDTTTIKSVNCGANSPKWAYSAPLTTQTPEPATLSLLGAGLVGLAGLVRRKK